MAYPTPTKKPATLKDNNVKSSGNKSQVGSLTRGVMTLAVFLVIVVGGIYLIKIFKGMIVSPDRVFTGEYQALFLDNGQVYFGKLQKTNNDSYVVLQDIYYLQVVTQPLQRTQELGEGNNSLTGEDEQRLTLVKLGNELHGPKDEMVINRDHLVILEDLRDDSRVVQAIKDYKASAQ